MSARSDRSLDTYFRRLGAAFEDIAAMCSRKTWIVQVVGFNDVETQLPRYLSTLSHCGLKEVAFDALSNRSDGRLWRACAGAAMVDALWSRTAHGPRGSSYPPSDMKQGVSSRVVRRKLPDGLNHRNRTGAIALVTRATMISMSPPLSSPEPGPRSESWIIARLTRSRAKVNCRSSSGASPSDLSDYFHNLLSTLT